MASDKTLTLIVVFSPVAGGRTTWLKYASAKVSYLYSYYSVSDVGNQVYQILQKRDKKMVINLDGVDYGRLQNELNIKNINLDTLPFVEYKNVPIKKALKGNLNVLNLIPEHYHSLTFEQIMKKFQIASGVRFNVNPQLLQSTNLVLIDGFQTVDDLKRFKSYLDSIKINYKLYTIFIYTNPDAKLTIAEELSPDLLIANDETIHKLKENKQFEKITLFK